MKAQLLPPQLHEYFADSTVTDILVNQSTEVWIERHGILERGNDLQPGQIEIALERILTPLGRRLDRLSPIVDARLPDGTRVCAVIHPIAVHGTTAAFRLFRQEVFALNEFCEDSNQQFLHEALLELSQSQHNILITGATGSGKTCLVSSLVSDHSGQTSTPSERIIVIEDTHELVISHPHTVRLEARNATAEGRGHISLDDLLRSALRLRPDRLIVGEVRGLEALTLVQAMNTGHSRCLATMHANSALDGLHRLDLLTMQAAPGWTLQDARHMVDSAIDVVIHMSRRPYGKRLVTQIAKVISSPPTESHPPRLQYIFRHHDS
jgi:pilus assembly protein CpaF